MENKKVAFLIGTLSSGGAERAVSNISLNISKGIEQEIILFGSSSKIYYPHASKIKFLDKFEDTNLIRKIISFFKRVSQIRIMKQNKDTTIISLLEYPNVINSLIKGNGKTYVSVRNHMSSKHRKGKKAFFWNMTIKHLYKRTDGIIVVSEEIKRDLMKKYGIKKEKIKIIYNSYPIEEIKKSANEDIIESYSEIFKHPVIITSGRLNKQKGHWHLIRSFFEVKKQVPNAKLVFLGEGNLKEYLIELAVQMGIENDIYFLGFQKNPFKYISKSQVFVMSSLYEGFPNALAEAMACGVPVISSDCASGPREILSPDEYGDKEINYHLNTTRYGLLAPVCDGNRYTADFPLTKEEKVMAEHIILILKNNKIASYFKEQSLIRIEDFNIKKIIREWETLI